LWREHRGVTLAHPYFNNVFIEHEFKNFNYRIGQHYGSKKMVEEGKQNNLEVFGVDMRNKNIIDESMSYSRSILFYNDDRTVVPRINYTLRGGEGESNNLKIELIDKRRLEKNPLEYLVSQSIERSNEFGGKFLSTSLAFSSPIEKIGTREFKQNF